VSQGFKIVDPAGDNWIYFTYDIDATDFTLNKGFRGNYSLGNLKRNIKNSAILRHFLGY
jgi:hypothetical protein